jgi:hypothetical protein
MEYLPPYDIHFKRYFIDWFNRALRRICVRFVTQHQEMQKKILNGLFSFNLKEICTPGLSKWLNAIDPKESAGASDWHTYR